MENETPTRQLLIDFSPKILAHDLEGGVTVDGAPFLRIDVDTVVNRTELSDKARSDRSAYVEAEMTLNSIAKFIRTDESFRKQFIAAFTEAAQGEIPKD